MRARGGATLIELIVTIAIIAVIAGTAGLAMRPAPASGRDDRSPDARVAALRGAALARATPLSDTVAVDGRLVTVTAFPDGRVVADSALHVDQLSGRAPHDAR